MDLGTVRARVMDGTYDHFSNQDLNAQTHVANTSYNCKFMEDVNLVWSNCQKYNHETFLVHQYSLQLKKLSDKLFNDWVLSDNKPRIADIK